MKKQFISFIILIVVGGASFAQSSNAILFTENGEKFIAILNGLRQNNKPETNVKITGLNAEWYKLKVIFDNAALGEKSFNLGVQLGNETSYSIKKNSKGEYVLRLISSVPMAQAPAATATQTVVNYNNNQGAQNTGGVSHSQTTTTTTTHEGNPDNVNMNMGVNMGEQGGNISINVSGMEGETVQTHTTTTTVTHTTTTQTYDPDPAPVAPPPHAYLPGYTGAVGCTPPMTPAEFSEVKGTISSKSFEETKITIAKQIMDSHCMFASQVKDLMGLFNFEESKLDIAKYAYDHTYDVGNYYKLNDAFTFSTSTDELNQYVNSRK